MAREAEEDGPTRAPKHLHCHQDLQGHPERQRNSTDPETKKYANIKRRLQTLKERYQDGIIDLMTYADSALEPLHLGH